MGVCKLLDCIGKTPLFQPRQFSAQQQINAQLYVKCERFNPTGSIQDRAALSIICEAEKKRLLLPGDTIVEAVVGKMGLSLAFVAAQKGYRFLAVVPGNADHILSRQLQALGAEVVTTSAREGFSGAQDKAMLLAGENPHSYIPDHSRNPARISAHYFSTGEDLWQDMDGMIDVLIIGIGSGATLTGCGTYLREVLPDVRIIGARMEEIRGLRQLGSAEPLLLRSDLAGEVIAVSREEAACAAEDFMAAEGLPVGTASGIVLAAAERVAKEQSAEVRIAVVLPD